MSSDQATSVSSQRRIKKLLPIIAAILALSLGAVAIYAVLIGPSKQPYRDALAQYQNVYNANVAFTNNGTAMNASSATNEQFKETIKTLRASKNSIEVENEALGTHQVLKDGEGKNLYEAFSERLTAYLAYNEDVIASIETLRPILFVCNSQMNIVTQDAAGAAALQKCATELDAAKSVPNDQYERMAERFSGHYNDAAQAIEAIAALKDPEGTDKATYNKLVLQREAAIEGLNTASTTLARDLQQSRNAVDITESAMKLDEYLKAQASIF